MTVSTQTTNCSALPQQRGFAIVTAITLLAIVTLCVVVLTAAFEHEIARTQQAHHRLQLQLLVSAGVIAVRQRMDETVAPARWQLALPVAVKNHGGLVDLRIVAGKSGRVVAAIFAAYAGLHTRQTVSFARTSGHWHVLSISLRENRPTQPGRWSAMSAGRAH